MTFCVFDAAACFEQVRFVNEGSGKAGILAGGKETFEQFRVPVRVDDESVHSYGYQMIERKSNERLLKDRDQRLWQLVGQRTQARAKAGRQNKCLSDFVHEQKIERLLSPTLKLRRAGDSIHNRNRQGDARFLSQIKRPRAEVDDAMVPSQRFCAQQPGDGR